MQGSETADAGTPRPLGSPADAKRGEGAANEQKRCAEAFRGLVADGAGGGKTGEYALSILAALLGVACSLAPYFIMIRIITGLVNGTAELSRCLTLCLWMAGFWALRYVLHSISTTISHHATFHVLAQTRIRLMDKLAMLPLGTVLERSSGSYKNIIVERVDAIETTLAHLLPEMTTNIVGALAVLALLFSVDWRMGLSMLIVVPLGGVDIRTLPLSECTKRIAYVSQDNYLFDLSVMDNIRMGRKGATDAEVIDAAKKCGCHEFIMSLENGYQTVCGAAGGHLSGGERQRISIARAIMKDAPIILLDEATANVDPENEKELMEAVDELTHDKTVILIAHRLKTVRNADRIFVVDHGRIVQQGTHDQLVAVDGLYRRFVVERRQAAGWKV